MNELLKIQAELHAPKDKSNSFGGYKYRSCEGILEAVKPLLKANGCTLTLSDDVVNIGERYYIMATAVLRNSEGVEARAVALAREEETKKGMDAAQITGAASSYARKYALNGLFAIDDTKDPDTDEYYKRTHEQPQQKPRARKQITHELIDEPITSESLLGWMFDIYEKGGYQESFDCIATMRKHYDIDDAVAKRFAQLFESYKIAKMTPKMR